MYNQPDMNPVCAQAPSEARIPQALSSLEVHCEGLIQIISMLEDKLGPAMRAPSPEKSEKEQVVRNPSCELDALICRATGVVGEAQTRLHRVLHRLEL